MTNRPPAILEQIFTGNTARVLDHLSLMRHLEFTYKELSNILEIPGGELLDILKKLMEFKLVEKKPDNLTNRLGYILSENEKTMHILKLQYLIMMDFLDHHSEKKND